MGSPKTRKPELPDLLVQDCARAFQEAWRTLSPRPVPDLLTAEVYSRAVLTAALGDRGQAVERVAKALWSVMNGDYSLRWEEADDVVTQPMVRKHAQALVAAFLDIPQEQEGPDG